MDGVESLYWLGWKPSVGLLAIPLPNSLVVDGIIAGAGGVVGVLAADFNFVLYFALEESGYLPRARFAG